MEIVFLLAAELDLFQAYEQSGEPLHNKIDATLDQLKLHPRIGPMFKEPFRRKLIIKTPYAIYYTIEGERIIIHAIVDQRQNPDSVTSRL
jgi:plasmid stabilization system protein ParE